MFRRGLLQVQQLQQMEENKADNANDMSTNPDEELMCTRPKRRRTESLAHGSISSKDSKHFYAELKIDKPPDSGLSLSIRGEIQTTASVSSATQRNR